jgi:hypothetical protein
MEKDIDTKQCVQLERIDDIVGTDEEEYMMDEAYKDK